LKNENNYIIVAIEKIGLKIKSRQYYD